MAGVDETYQVGIGIEQGAQKLFVGEEAELKFFDEEFSGKRLKHMIMSMGTLTNYISETSVLAASVFSPEYGYAMLSLAAGCSKASIKLPSAQVGARLVINLQNVESGAAISILAASAGGNASLTGIDGTDLSALAVDASNKDGIVTLVAIDEDSWAVVENAGGVVTEQASA